MLRSVVLFTGFLVAAGFLQNLGVLHCRHWLSAEPNEVLKMKHSLTPARVFRVTGARVVNSTLVVEDIERGEFTDLGGCGIEPTFLAEVSGTASADKYAFCALAALRRRGLGELAEPPQQSARSIDEAVDLAADRAEAWMRERIEFQERWLREHPIGGSEPKEAPAAPTESMDSNRNDPAPRSAVGQGSGPIGEWVTPSPDEQRQIEEQAKQQIRNVWHYGRGKLLEWRRVGRTPRGRDYDVLTVDGAEQLYPGPTSIDTSQR